MDKPNNRKEIPNPPALLTGTANRDGKGHPEKGGAVAPAFVPLPIHITERSTDMAKYVYPAIFVPEEKGMFSVFFPDIEGCTTCGNDLPHAMEMAEDALSLMLYDMEEEGGRIPAATQLRDVATEGSAFASYISADTFEYRKKFNNRAVKKTLSIPSWLNDSAIAAGLNFSQVLQDALKQQLNII